MAFIVEETPNGIMVTMPPELQEGDVYLGLIECRNDAAAATGNGPGASEAWPYAPSLDAAEKWRECAETFAVTRGLTGPAAALVSR